MKLTFFNGFDTDAFLHLRIGAVGTHPDQRPHSNTVLHPEEGPVHINVNEGDAWYCFGRQVVNDNNNPPLCNAAGGATVQLNATLTCYVAN